MTAVEPCGIEEGLERAAIELAKGPRAERVADLEGRVRALVEPARGALENLVEAARRGQAEPDALDQCRQIRRRIETLGLLVSYAQQVCGGVRGIVAMAYQAHQGAQYSSSGEPMVARAPRLLLKA